MTEGALEVEGIEIVGTASAFPLDLDIGREVTNEDAYRELLGDGYADELERRGWSSDHPETAWGVRARQWLADPGRPATAQGDAGDLACEATRKALDDAGLSPADVELLVVATSTPPRLSSTLASRVGRELAIEAPCLDLRAGGAGGLCAWVTATRFLNAGTRNAVVVAAEALSPVLDRGDLANALLFGDGAGALVLRRVEDRSRGLAWSSMGNAEIAGRAFTVPGPLPPTWAVVETGGYVFQAPDARYAAALGELRVSIATDLARELSTRNLVADIAVPYAASLPQARAQADALGVALERVGTGLADRGCLGAAAAFVAIDEARRGGRLEPGRCLAACAAGGGVAWASLVWRT